MKKAPSLFSRIKNFIFDYKFTPVVLLLLCILSYGIFIPVTGFFVDDWYIIWFKHVFGALQFPAYFSADRPLMGYFYTLASFLLGGSESPIVWGIFAVVLRWFSTVALWWMLQTIWPNSRRQNSLVALLAAVLPGFTQHWFVVIYSFFYACLGFFFLSIVFMIKAIREPKRFWIYYPLSFLLGSYSMISEFFFGLELIRPIILYMELSNNSQPFGKQLISILKYWGAFFAVFIGFAIWRTLFDTGVNHPVVVTSSLSTDPWGTILSILRLLYQAISNSVVFSWIYPFNPTIYPKQGLVSFLIPAAILLVLIILFIWLFFSGKSNEDKNKREPCPWHWNALILGFSALVFADIPFLAAGINVDYLGFDSRPMLAFELGSCLIIVLIFDALSAVLRKGKFLISSLAIIFLVSVGVGYQISNANYFKNIWIRQKDLFWQLIWRIPGLQPGTTLFTYGFESGGDLYSGNAFTAEINWTYSSEVKNRQIDYEYIILDSDQIKLVESLDKDIPIYIDFRSYLFKGNTSQSIYISPSTVGCVRILDKNLTPPETVIWKFGLVPYEPIRKDIIAGSDLTDLNLILSDGVSPNHPPLQVLGAEITHSWCYYFQKAELARQFKNYQTVLSLLKEANTKGYSPLVDTEWYPFIDAYSRSGDWQSAISITNELANKDDEALHLGLCHLWEKLAEDFNDTSSIKITSEEIQSVLNCVK